MVIPRGNVLFEKQSLPYADINVLYGNLEQEGFTGFVKLDNDTVQDFLFFNHGQFLRVVEQDEASARVMALTRVLNRVKGDVSVSVYVLPSTMVNVLSLAFAFQPVYRNVEIRKKEFKKIREQMESDEQTGVLEINSREATVYLLIDRGKIVFNNFAPAYGQIVCGLEDVNRFLDYVGKSGAQLNVYAEKAGDIEVKRRESEERLERVKVLLAKTQGGLFKNEKSVEIDEYIIREWGLRSATSTGLEIELPDGAVITVTGQAAKKVGGYVLIPAKMMKKIGLRDGDALSVQPIM